MENQHRKTVISYLDYYNLYIRPVINRLDIAIKCNERLKDEYVSELLNLDISEILTIKKEYKLKGGAKAAIMTFLNAGSSEICRMFKREMEMSSPYVYSAEQVAYIYGIKAEAVGLACEKLGVNLITKENIFDVFAEIPIEGVR